MTERLENEAPSVLKQSRAKLWIRTMILVIFGTLFFLALRRDVGAGVFRWVWGVACFIPFLGIGFLMRSLVPMQVHIASRCITFSFDRVYFSVILFLVVVKVTAGHIPVIAVVADIVMCIILGLMIGRLSGICLRVRDLKKKHDLID